MTRVLVLDANQRSALATTRSLGRRGIPVIAANEVGGTLAGASQYCRETLTCPSPYSNPDAFVGAVQAALTARAVDLVLPMTEVTTELFPRHRSELGGVALPFGPLEGIEARPDHHALRADTPREFADAMASVLTTEPLARRLGENGYRLVKEASSWTARAESLEQTLRTVVAGRAC